MAASDSSEKKSPRRRVARAKTAKKRGKKATATTASPAEPRRRPTQARSQRRYESIVMAAAESFAAFGFTDTTMEGIAARAGTSIGSVYQFFPNKHAIFREVAQRCIARSRETYGELLGDDPGSQPWHTLLDRFVDRYWALHRDDVVMRAVWRNLELYGEFAEADQALMRELTGATALLFAAWGPALSAERRAVIAKVLINCFVGSLVMLMRETEAQEQEAVLHEIKRLLRGYMAGYFGEVPV